MTTSVHADHESISASEPLKTPFYEAHVGLGARMVPFAGYLMPVQYEGILAEHAHCRAAAGLFDVSHMGQATLVGPDHATTAGALEALVPADILNLLPGKQRYSQLLNAEGGILDDLMVHRLAGADGPLGLVVNAACKDADYAHIAAHLPAGVRLDIHADRALLALQGAEAVNVLVDLGADVAGWDFMDVGPATLAGIPVHLSRSGYTGEDGFEISLAATDAATLWGALVADARVKAIGLGARDSLRLEGGLCLYGHDIDTTTSPVEAGLLWSIQKRRREEGGFPGADRIKAEIAGGVARKRVGIRPEGRAPARDGTEIVDDAGNKLGIVTSGGFGPTIGGPIAMGYVKADHAKPTNKVYLVVRGKPLPAEIVTLPFVPARFHRAAK